MENEKIKDEFLVNEDKKEFSNILKIAMDNENMTKRNVEIFDKSKKRGNKKIISCTYPGCSMKFTRPFKFRMHFCSHTGERQFVCNFNGCDKAYSNNTHLKRHKLSHKQKDKQEFPCELCDAKYTERHNLNRHYSIKHKRKDCSQQSCEECSLVFRTVNNLKQHMTEVHNRKLHVCHICSKSFTYLSILRRHLESSVHKVNYICQICQNSFNTFDDLKKHKKEHITIYKEFTCDICGKIMSLKNNLKEHMKMHQEPSNFICPHDGCFQEYDYQRNLDSHIRIHHMNVRFECELCSRKLSTKQKLLEHIMKIHENPVPRKHPPSKENRKRRRDTGVPKKSAVSILCGLKMQSTMEKIIRNRHIKEKE